VLQVHIRQPKQHYPQQLISIRPLVRERAGWYDPTAVFALCITSGAANAAEWKFNNGLPEGRNESKELDQFAADVAEQSNGSLNIKVFHGGSLKLENNDVARWLPKGAVEMGLVWANYP